MKKLLSEVLAVLKADARVRKASAAFYAFAAGSLALSMADGSVSGSEVVVALGAGLGATAAVYGFKNK